MKSRSAEKSPKPARRAKGPPLLKKILKALEEKKAGDIRILEVEKLSSITNYLVLATATSEPHLRALRIELERVFSEGNSKVLGRDTAKGSGWSIIDGADIIIHLFLSEVRIKYRLEMLWRDAPVVYTAG